VAMVPTGGVNLDTAADFIQAGAAALGIGGELVSAAACQSGNLKVITEAARLYVAIVQEARRSAKRLASA
jgi:2-dehydro-3-deoxyphosphogluconate aldolase / (4S)-4-hydroxy-2-oxoglutarate aldolase